MPLYQYLCKKCNAEFDDWEEMAHYKKKHKCPKCKKLCKRAIGKMAAFKIPGSPMKWSKSDVTRLYNECIDDSKERLNSKESPYVKYDMDEKWHAEHGAKKLTSEELAKKIEVARKQTIETQELIKNNPV